MQQKQWDKIFRKNTLFEQIDPKDAFRTNENATKKVLREGKLNWKKTSPKRWESSDNKYEYEINQGRSLVSLDVYNKKLRHSGKNAENDSTKTDEVSYVGGGTYKSIDDAKQSAEKGEY